MSTGQHYACDLQSLDWAVAQEFEAMLMNQMVQQMRNGELQQGVQGYQSFTPEATPPNYDDVVRQQHARDERLQRYAAEMDRLYARYRELEEQKRPLLDELAALSAQGR